MSENTQTVIERARGAAEREWSPTDGWQVAPRIWMNGVTFAATISSEQVEAAARVMQGIERNAGNVAGIEWCRRRVQDTFTAAGFQVEANR